MANYAIGLDYGTLSGRAVLVRLSDGSTVGYSVYEYPHGVMDTVFAPDGLPPQKLPADWALQHPRDYLDVLEHTIPDVLQKTGIDPREIAGIGVDFTACSPLPVTGNGTPLGFLDTYKTAPHAYVKLWKHHGAQAYADRIQTTAEERGEDWLRVYGGRISSEWMLPKLYQTAAEAPEIYAAMAAYVEAGDWLVWQLTGSRTASACMAGYKGNLTDDGYPTREFLTAVDPLLADAGEKWQYPVSDPGAFAGGLTEDWAARLGLVPGTPVGVAVIDGHAAVPAAGIRDEGQMLIIMGTSSCHMLLEKEKNLIPGICGVIKNGMVPGFYGYEAGQCCVGDHFSWLCDHLLPVDYAEEAEKRSISPQALLSEKAALLSPGASGLVALDWWNGNRSVLADASLSGCLLGMTLSTRAEDIFRALIEATAYGTRKIVENYRENGLAVQSCIVTGGIAEKNPLILQIYADVLHMDIRIAGGTSALGAAICGAAAAGDNGYATMEEAAAHMGYLTDTVYHPSPDAAAVYDRLYGEYLLLHDYFGRGGNDVMKRLREYRNASAE